MTELKTGADRAVQRQAERQLEVYEIYKDTRIKGDTRATKRRAEKQEEKHKKALTRIMSQYKTKKYTTVQD